LKLKRECAVTSSRDDLDNVTRRNDLAVAERIWRKPWMVPEGDDRDALGGGVEAAGPKSQGQDEVSRALRRRHFLPSLLGLDARTAGWMSSAVRDGSVRIPEQAQGGTTS